jgi:hypothetical protein
LFSATSDIYRYNIPICGFYREPDPDANETLSPKELFRADSQNTVHIGTPGMPRETLGGRDR